MLTSSLEDDLNNFISSISTTQANIIINLLELKKISSKSTIFELKLTLNLDDVKLNILKKILSNFKDICTTILCLKYSLTIKNMISAQKESTHLVWTGPIVYNKNIDNTSRVMLEMINSATKSITLVGYLIQNGSKKIFNALYNIQLKKNIKIRFIFNDGDKYYNKIRTYWPESEKLPPIYTYKPKKPNTSLHAKIIIIDSCDILVTSANLTNYGINENIEMGIRSKANLANDAENLFDSLIEKNFLVRTYGYRRN